MQSSENFAYNDCIFCGEEKNTGLTIMMNEALIAKHINNQSDHLLASIDVLLKLEEPCTPYEAWSAFQFR